MTARTICGSIDRLFADSTNRVALVELKTVAAHARKYVRALEAHADEFEDDEDEFDDYDEDFEDDEDFDDFEDDEDEYYDGYDDEGDDEF